MTTSLLRSLAGGFFLTGIFTSAAPAGAQTLQYPTARKSDVVDDYHGTRVPDPYRWLEDPDSPESRAWIEAQNRLTEAYLAAIPARTTIRDRISDSSRVSSVGHEWSCAPGWRPGRPPSTGSAPRSRRGFRASPGPRASGTDRALWSRDNHRRRRSCELLDIGASGHRRVPRS